MTTATTEQEAPSAMGARITLTPLAVEKVQEIRLAEAVEAQHNLRVKVLGGGCSGFQYDLFFDDAQPGDYTFESDGVTVVCDQMSFMYVMGVSIDYVDGLTSSGFKFTNPNSSGSCGCGSSFSV